MYIICHFQQIQQIFQAEVNPFMSCSLIDKNICTYICVVFNPDVITKIKNTFHTAGINSFSMYVQILDTARRWNPRTHAKDKICIVFLL